MKLFCLPYAGGGVATFRLMRGKLSGVEVIPMCLPGRDQLFDQPPVDELGALVQLLAKRYIENVAEPYAIYGHSMGSLIGFELIRYVQRIGLRLPCHFLVGARGAPELSGEYERLSGLNDERFIAKIMLFGGFQEAIYENEALMNFIMPMLRNDFRMLDAYQYLHGAPLPVPITSFHGAQDATVRQEWVKAWEFETSAKYQHVTIPGGHFFVTDPHSPLFRHINELLNGQGVRADAELTTASIHL